MKNYLRYIYAILAIPLAILLRFAVVPLIGYGIPYIILFPVTTAVALLAGLVPAVLTGLLGSVITDYFFIPPLHEITVDIPHITRTSIMVLTSIFVGYIGQMLRAGRAKAELQALALRQSEERLKRAQEIAHLGSWELDLVNNSLYWSDEAYRIFGLKPQEFGATYEAFLEAVHPEDREAVDAAYSGSLRDGKDIYEIEHRIVRKSTGEIRYVHEKCEHFRDVAGRVILSVGMVHDVTERKLFEEENRRLNEDLQRHVVQLESANRELEAFSYSVSHDLRSPLRSIVGFSQALWEDYAGKLDADGLDSLKRIVSAAQRMGQLIDDLLNLSRVTRTDMKREQVDLSRIAARTSARLTESHQERQTEFIIAEGLVAGGDERLLSIALENLINNAWKFTANNPHAVIEFGMELHDGQPEYFVRDNGAGFDMAYADKLFSPFQRLHSLKEYPGTGIGLATVKRIVNRHGGHVRINGEPGKGAVVYFTLS